MMNSPYSMNFVRRNASPPEGSAFRAHKSASSANANHLIILVRNCPTVLERPLLILVSAVLSVVHTLVDILLSTTTFVFGQFCYKMNWRTFQDTIWYGAYSFWIGAGVWDCTTPELGGSVSRLDTSPAISLFGYGLINWLNCFSISFFSFLEPSK